MDRMLLMNVRCDQVLGVPFATLRETLKLNPNVKPTTPREPRQIEVSYFSELRKVFGFQNKIIRDLIMPSVPKILRDARVNSIDIKFDDYIDDTENLIAQASVEFKEVYPDERLAAIASQHGALTSNFNRNYYDRLYRIIGVNPLLNEPWLADKLKDFTKTNVSLITDANTAQLAKVEKSILRGAQSGATVKSVQAEILKTFPDQINKAKLIATDQILTFNANLHKIRQEQVGIKKYKWQTSEDNRVRPSHRANNKKTFSWSSPPSTGHPGKEIRCRCVPIAVVNL